MGFNNHGVHALVANIRASDYQGILGINIGKNKATSLDKAADDYVYCMRQVYPYANYLTVNISSPNTPDLRQLQQGEYFAQLIRDLVCVREELATTHQKWVPLVVKVSPDETDETLKRIVEVLVTQGVEGIIATNTTSSREGVESLPKACESGGLSGAPLREKALQCLRLLKHEAGDALTLIASGGIDSAAAAEARLHAGASLVQVYTGLVYRGPKLMQELTSH
jgi:dihydroorotate dehydrogenase